MSGEKILVVDDDRENLESLAEYVLRPRGYECITAHNGEEGLERALNEKPDLIILDLRMPKMTGLEVLTEMRDRGESFFDFAHRMSKQHQHYFTQLESLEDQFLLEQEAGDSWRRQREIEVSDKVSFDRFLADYFSQEL